MSIKSDLLHSNVIDETISQIEKIKNWIIAAGTGNIDFPDVDALNHLFTLVEIERNLTLLQGNIKDGAIKFDPDKQ